jgi:hypothetical protein
MDMIHVTDAVKAAALESDPDGATRLLVVYLAPGDGGLYVYRLGCGLHQLGGDNQNFASSMRAAVEKLWPESSKETRQWLRIAVDFLARSPVAKMLRSDGDL